ncbi:MAG: hypothetical protein K5656_02645 [Lachnospiraceae bacterium]|nr:hypothetical protein [Lachnospiraceae bacterium]
MKHTFRSMIIVLILAATAVAAFTLALSITSETVNWDYDVENVVIDVSTDTIKDATDTTIKNNTKASANAKKNDTVSSANTDK